MLTVLDETLQMKSPTFTQLAAAVASVLLLVLLSMAILRVVDTADRRYVANHITANLDSIVKLLHLMEEDDTNRVRVIAENPDMVVLAGAVLENPQNQRAADALKAWITTVYRSRGFVGFSLISPGHRIVLASSPAFTGKPVQTAGGLGAINRALQFGAAISPPLAATLPVVNEGKQLEPGTLYQLACARIVTRAAAIGILCLRSDPALRLFKLLEAGRTGATGEAYVIDDSGRILSPSRFENYSRNSGATNPFPLFARAQNAAANAGRIDSVSGTLSLTLVAERLLRNRQVSTGYLEEYADYRSVRVVGDGQWLPNTGMGVIVEEDFAEAFYANRISHYTIIAFTIVAALLIIFLTAFQRRARQSLAQSEELHKAFRENSPNGTVMRDLDGKVLLANRRYDELMGLRHGVSIGETDWGELPNEVAKIFIAEHKEVMRNGTVTEQIRYVKSLGMTIRVLGFPVRKTDGSQIIGVGMLVSDISALVRAQQALEVLNRDLEARVEARTRELAEARDAAEAAARAKAEFLANMSHEIRTPMNAIIGMSYLALSNALAPQARNYIEKIRNAGQHLLGIINSILDFSKIEAGKFNVDNAPFSLLQLVENVTGFVRDKADAKGLRLLVDLDPQLPTAFVGDSLRIGQILINFCSNAVKFTESGAVTLGIRQVGTREGASVLRFDVSDTGLGISEAALQQLFQPFYQVDNSSTRQFEGTGLGLAISKSLAELLGGSISARSILGKGSTFSLEVALPLVAEQPDSPFSLSAVPRPSAAHSVVDLVDLSGIRVLLVEDNDINQEVAVAILRSFGMYVGVANNGAEAVQLVKSEIYAAVLMDIQMPVLDGFAATRAIRADSAIVQPLIIAMTANALSGDRERCLDAGMNDYVAKPIEPAQLLSTLSHWLGRERTEISAPLSTSVSPNALPYAQLQTLGLDTDKALSLLLGREALYARVLQRFVSERADLPQQLATALADKDFPAAINLVHSLKSLAGTIGAHALQKICAEMENDLRDQCINNAQIEAFNTETTRLIEQLLPLLSNVQQASDYLPRA